jgi:type IV secretion system protein VirD4
MTNHHIARPAPPVTGKGGMAGGLASAIVRHPGPVLAITTKHHVFELTSSARARRGPVHVLAPEGAGGVVSTVRWNPLEGCRDPATAIRRASAFAQSIQRRAEDTGFWAGKASDYLRAYLFAAAAEGLDLTCVARWVTATDSVEAEQILSRAGSPGPQWGAQLAELRGEATMTTRTIRMMMSRALAFLADPALSASVLPVPGQSMNLEAFLHQAGILYLIGGTRGEDSPAAPLFACLASELQYTAALAGSRMPGGRLDPPFLLALDEVTEVCPVLVSSWLASSGRTGIHIITAGCDTRLPARQGHDGARALPVRGPVRQSYSARLATRITPGVDARLRQLALVRRRRISHVLDEVLDAALPTAADLITQMAALGRDEESGDGRR